ncbi:MAG: glycerophosphodiester phosphodiesterase [Treponema sp.]|nr:glycerophosphodiester phosphodiesterase [Treponema sp.]
MSRVPLLPERPRPLIFAHRGCSSLAPENTMAAFRKARETGAGGIELDLHATADGRLIVAHDDTFKRTAPAGNNGGGRPLEELSYGEIKHLDVGSFFAPAFSAERPPLLEEVLEEFCPALYFDIELKSRRIKNDPLPDLAAKKLKMLGPRIAGAFTVSSFNPFCLAAFKKAWERGRGALPPAAAAVIYCAAAEVPLLLRHGVGRFIAACDYLKPRRDQAHVWRRMFAALEGRPLVPWTVDDPAIARWLLDRSCAGIITNRPQDMVPALAV